MKTNTEIRNLSARIDNAVRQAIADGLTLIKPPSTDIPEGDIIAHDRDAGVAVALDGYPVEENPETGERRYGAVRLYDWT